MYEINAESFYKVDNWETVTYKSAVNACMLYYTIAY